MKYFISYLVVRTVFTHFAAYNLTCNWQLCYTLDEGKKRYLKRYQIQKREDYFDTFNHPAEYTGMNKISSDLNRHLLFLLTLSINQK